ncbi:MAG TPA: hypothetical protein VK357_06230 [Rubrobacteraceae bacterium]|nr:hypothetical protein [Rubrobacteraceae bacterium]
MRGWMSGRLDNQGRAGPRVAAVFREVILIGFRDIDEKGDVVPDEREEGLNVTHGEVFESALDRLIQKRHDLWVAEEGERLRDYSRGGS